MNKVNVNKVVDYANLLKENERLNNELELQNIEMGREIERLNNIINDFEKDLIHYFKDEFPREVSEILDKIVKELKEK